MSDCGLWFLLNASPDLRTQIEQTASLQPQRGPRESPIAGVLMTGGDIDQVAGLLSLRELQPFRIYCSPAIRHILQNDNSVFGMLNRVPRQVRWTDIILNEHTQLRSASEEACGISVQFVPLGTNFPAYVSAQRAATLNPDEALLGLVISGSSGRSLAYFPSVPKIEMRLLELLESTDLVLFDGTFWTDDELIRTQGTGSTALEIGHVPISGVNGTLRRLAGLRRPRKIFIHVNNTNPILDESGDEYDEVRAAGWEIAEDGWEINL